MKKRLGVLSVVTVLVMAFFALSAVASISELYFSSDKNGQNRVTNVQEGSQVWMVVYDPDENIDCDVRDKFWTDAKVFDPKTGAYLNFAFAPIRTVAPLEVEAYGKYLAGHYPTDPTDVLKNYAGKIVYFEETGADTGLFVSSQPMQIGTRLNYRVASSQFSRIPFFPSITHFIIDFIIALLWVIIKLLLSVGELVSW